MAESVKKGDTGKFVRQGQTAGEYGNDPAVKNRPAPARELKP